MRLTTIIYEDFVNYKKPSMFLSSCFCDFKCCKEGGFGIEICQNHSLSNTFIKNYPDDILLDLYVKNPITKAVVIGGLEPMLQINEIYDLIYYFRKNQEFCDFVIYSGYYHDEIQDVLDMIRPLKNIIVKYGRYIPNRQTRYDDVLGRTLISDNQYAEVLC